MKKVVTGGIFSITAGFLLLTFFLMRPDSKIEINDISIPKEIESIISQIPHTALFPPPKPVSKQKAIVFEDFVGSEACAQCHDDQYQYWLTSAHGRAGGKPDAENVIGKFDGTRLYFKDAVVIPSINDKNEYIFTVEQVGFDPQIIKVDYLVGGGLMVGGGTQTCFSQFPDGTLRFLPFDYIKEEDIWFVQLRKDDTWVPISGNLSLNELAHWPPYRILGTELSHSNCQNCHGSQILVISDPQKKQLTTKFKSLDINCESCHGPGKRHINIALSDEIDRLTDIGMTSMSLLNKDQSLLICFQCHAVKDPVKEGFLPGEELEEYYSLKLPILGNNPYLPGGRVRSFAYQQNHLFSACYVSGSMTCVDCHSPHSLKYRDIYGTQLDGRFDNGQCLDCHPSKAEAPELHSHHAPGTEGDLCTSCHMPYLQQQGIGEQLRFARSDHTIPIPRPEFDSFYGIENACKKCHNDKSITWIQDRTEEWYGELKPINEWISGLIEASNVMDRETASEVLLNNSTLFPIAQVTNLIYFITHYLTPNMEYLEYGIVSMLKDLTDAEDIDLKSLAYMSLHFCCGEESTINNFLVERIKSLGKNEIPVRTRWGIAVDDLGTMYLSKKDINSAIASYIKATEINPMDRLAWVHLGKAYLSNRNPTQAVESFEKVLEIIPSDVTTKVLLARAYTILNQIPKAIKLLKEVLEIEPENTNATIMLKRLLSSNAQ